MQDLKDKHGGFLQIHEEKYIERFQDFRSASCIEDNLDIYRKEKTKELFRSAALIRNQNRDLYYLLPPLLNLCIQFTIEGSESQKNQFV